MTTPAYPIPHDAVTPCAANPELMFPGKKDAPRRVAAAKKVCEPCDYRAGCLAWALAYGEQGVWGGTGDEDRAALREEMGITAKSVEMKVGLWAKAPRSIANHGTGGGVTAHYRAKEKPCDACRSFDNARKRATRKSRAKAPA